MRRFSIFHPLLLSFYSKELYQDVGRQWAGTGFLYLLLLLALIWVPTMTNIHIGFGKWVEGPGKEMVKELPKITITNGVVESDPPGRHEIKDPETGEVMLIIDTSIEAINLDEFPAPSIILTRTKLITKQKDASQTRVNDLAGVNFTLDRAGAEEGMRVLAKWLVFLMYPFALLGSFVYRICQALLYSVFGTALNGATGAKLDYLSVLRLTCVAVTPAVLVNEAITLSKVKIPLWWLICFAIAIYYVWFGLRACAEAPATPAADAQVPPPIAG